MIRRIRQQFESVRCLKHHTFNDFEPIIQRCFRDYAHLFPARRIKKDGSKFVYHPNVEGLPSISLEKEHGAREFIPRRYAKFAISGIDDLVSYIEGHPDAEREQTEVSNPEDSTRNEINEVANAGNEDTGLLREPKVPDGDC
jgi:hypothetical protein